MENTAVARRHYNDSNETVDDIFVMRCHFGAANVKEDDGRRRKKKVGRLKIQTKE